MLNIKQFRGKSKGLPDLLNIAHLVSEGVFSGKPYAIALQKDGSFLCGFRFAGPDVESASSGELEGLSSAVSGAMLRLGTGWATHISAIRRVVDGYIAQEDSAFVHPVARLIDDERREQYHREGGHFETDHVVVFSWMPPDELDENVASLALRRPEKAQAKADAIFDRWISQFRDRVETVVGMLSAYTHKLAPLNARALLTHLHECITADPHPVNAPRVPAYLDALLGAHDFVAGFEPSIDGKRIGAISITGFAAETFPEIVEGLSMLPIPLRYTARFLPLDATDAVPLIEKYRRAWYGSRHTLMSQIGAQFTGQAESPTNLNMDAVTQAADAQQAKSEATSGEVRYGYMSLTVVVTDKDEQRFNENVKAVETYINNAGFVALAESANAVEAWLGSIPGHKWENVRRPIAHAVTYADLAPTTGIFAGEDACPSPMIRRNGVAAPPLLYAATGGGTPFRLNLHVGDLGHTLILGPTGAGKSTLLNLLDAQFMRYENARVFVFDKGLSAYALCASLGGAHYDIGSEHADLSFAPLSRIDTPEARALAEEWVEALVVLQDNKPVTPAERDAIHKAMEGLAVDPEARSLTDFRANVQNERIKDALTYYTTDGRAGTLLDAREDRLDLSNSFTVVELEHLLNGGDASRKTAIPVLLYIFARIEAMLDGSPTLIVLDEAWVMLDNEFFAAKIREWLKVLRKKNAAVVFATQSLSDVVSSPLRPVLQESCPTKIFLPNREAGTNEQTRDMYYSFGLSDRQVEVISRAIPKSDYYVVSPLGRRLISLALGQVALAFCGVSSPQDVTRVRELAAVNGDRWPLIWLQERLPANIRDGWIEYAERLLTE